jgi:tetratricopeptide (TPR) repeat protein
MLMDTEAQDWAGVLADIKMLDPFLPKYPGVKTFLPTTTDPLLAYAEAKLGHIAAAEARIAATPADCDPCLRARARIAALEGQNARADWWFDRAARAAPSIPFAYADWGQALLGRGDADGAIAKFTLANKKGPHFADPLEMWGEAFMAKNRSDLALAKFTEAEKYAPNWGRLHLKWGEALFYAGKKDDARKQFAQAASLDLTQAEKAELMKRR